MLWICWVKCRICRMSWLKDEFDQLDKFLELQDELDDSGKLHDELGKLQDELDESGMLQDELG